MVPAKGSCTPIVAVSSGHTRANSSSICRRAGRSTPRLRRLRLRYGSISSQHHAAITAEASVSWSCEKLRDRAALLRDGTLLEVKNESVFRVRAYQRAAQTLETLAEDVAAVAARKDLTRLPGIGRDLAAR